MENRRSDRSRLKAGSRRGRLPRPPASSRCLRPYPSLGGGHFRAVGPILLAPSFFRGIVKLRKMTARVAWTAIRAVHQAGGNPEPVQIDVCLEANSPSFSI